MPIVPSPNSAPEERRSAEADASVSPPPARQSVVLEKDVPISESLIWQRQRDSYVQRGLKAWTEDMVPQFITNNPFIAEIYARIVFGFVCDWLNRTQSDTGVPPQSLPSPVRILELGAGPGKFSFLFLRQLEALLRSRNIPLDSVRYCMTDCSEGLVQAWPVNKTLSEFFDRGVLQCEVLDAGVEINSRFLSGETSESLDQPRGPLIVIANYVFDSLPHDAFVIEDGKVLELLQTTTPHEQDGRTPSAETLSQLKFSYRKAEINSGRYENRSWNDILAFYQRRLRGATVLFPSQTLKTLDALAEFTDGTMLVLAADKGHVHEDSLLASLRTPTYEFHAANCFSQLVNFDAIAKYLQSRGGEAFLPGKRSSSLHLCAFLAHQPAAQFPATKAAIQQAHSAIGPNDLFALLAWLNPHMEEMSVPQILALLKLSRWDPTTFVRLFPVLARQIRNVTIEKEDLRNAVLHTWANHFPISQSDNVLAFDCGVILLELQFFHEALSLLKQAQAALGRSAATSYNLGLCEHGLGRHSEAIALMAEACDLDPSFEPARLMRRKFEDSQSAK